MDLISNKDRELENNQEDNEFPENAFKRVDLSYLNDPQLNHHY